MGVKNRFTGVCLWTEDLVPVFRTDPDPGDPKSPDQTRSGFATLFLTPFLNFGCYTKNFPNVMDLFCINSSTNSLLKGSLLYKPKHVITTSDLSFK